MERGGGFVLPALGRALPGRRGGQARLGDTRPLAVFVKSIPFPFPTQTIPPLQNPRILWLPSWLSDKLTKKTQDDGGYERMHLLP